MFNVEIKNLEPMRIVGLPHTGPYMEISRSYTQLWQLLNTRQLYRQGMVGIGVYYDNPDITPPDQLNSFAAVSAPDDVQADAPLTEKILAGGTHAVLTFTGPYSDLHSAYHWLFGTWLPQSQRMIGSEPSYEIYRNDPMTTPPAELVTEICLPLQPE